MIRSLFRIRYVRDPEDEMTRINLFRPFPWYDCRMSWCCVFVCALGVCFWVCLALVWRTLLPTFRNVPRSGMFELKNNHFIADIDIMSAKWRQMSCRLDTQADTTFSPVGDMIADMSPTCCRHNTRVAKSVLRLTQHKTT